MRGRFFVLTIAWITASHAYCDPSGMAFIPGGTYKSFFKSQSIIGSQPKGQIEFVEPFWSDLFPVTNNQFKKFVQKQTEWKKSKIKSIFSDSHYLKRWKNDLTLVDLREGESPVTAVSWFAAQAYCESVGKTLPTTTQWEYMAGQYSMGQEKLTKKILDWYGKVNPTHFPKVGSTFKNKFGIWDIHSLIWEWTLDFKDQDFNSAEGGKFCGAGSSSAVNPSDYATFMRYSFRSSLKSNFSVENLGFRCVKESSK